MIPFVDNGLPSIALHYRMTAKGQTDRQINAPPKRGTDWPSHRRPHTHLTRWYPLVDTLPCLLSCGCAFGLSLFAPA